MKARPAAGARASGKKPLKRTADRFALVDGGEKTIILDKHRIEGRIAR